MTIDPKNLSATATLTFSDEFNSLSLWNGTSGTWSTKYPFAPEKGGSLPSNGEQEWYINSMYAPTTSVRPWTVSNGVLTLTAQPASASIQPLIDGYQYTSGMINTFNSFTQTYGYFEMRAQLPAGQGLWPAFWLLQADMSWPPEIDVMEVLGHDMTTLYTAAHTNQTGSHTSKGGTIKVPEHVAGLSHLRRRLAGGLHHLLLRRKSGLEDGDAVRHARADVHDRQSRGRRILARHGQRHDAVPCPDEDRLHPGVLRQGRGDAASDEPTADGSASDRPADRWPSCSRLPTIGTYDSSSAARRATTRSTARRRRTRSTAGGGTDTMIGRRRKRHLSCQQLERPIVENANAGVDTVQSRSSSYTLPANVENLKLDGTGAQIGIGNALGNILMTSNNCGVDARWRCRQRHPDRGRRARHPDRWRGVRHLPGTIPCTNARPYHRLHGRHGRAGSARTVSPTTTEPIPSRMAISSFSSDGAGGTQVFFDADGGGHACRRIW